MTFLLRAGGGTSAPGQTAAHAGLARAAPEAARGIVEEELRTSTPAEGDEASSSSYRRGRGRWGREQDLEHSPMGEKEKCRCPAETTRKRFREPDEKDRERETVGKKEKIERERRRLNREGKKREKD